MFHGGKKPHKKTTWNHPASFIKSIWCWNHPAFVEKTNHPSIAPTIFWTRLKRFHRGTNEAFKDKPVCFIIMTSCPYFFGTRPGWVRKKLSFNTRLVRATLWLAQTASWKMDSVRLFVCQAVLKRGESETCPVFLSQAAFSWNILDTHATTNKSPTTLASRWGLRVKGVEVIKKRRWKWSVQTKGSWNMNNPNRETIF